MKVLVTGGRNYSDSAKVDDELFRLLDEHKHLVVIEGGAAGADQLAREWVFTQNRHEAIGITVPADWKRYGRMAGPQRNAKMLVEHRPDLVLAFPGGRGTADMIRRAEEAGVEVRRVA